ncbi:class I SAM-dependent methyltransferase [Sphingomonas sp. SUN039]|uniref:Eco57I restriction-modification methylase domain-containing protein n=1 Tax=Sphingomonas sp. SUN039 TaxID=2937787 RepID=UPI002164D856|nr:class I SAM-dependent methyltransferase [Sphingomonas sp. SUN039]UVO54405.1 class I SAM-dependent methyltransferase [Sphingomonas sp. SUN039]
MKFIEDQTAQKLRGGYYTPLDLAAFISRWVRDLEPKRVLEPSCGNGAFFQAMGDVGGFGEAKVIGFELDAAEARKASQKANEAGLPNVDVRASDFLAWAIGNMEEGGERFDAVVGNPPFVRYQFLPPAFQARAGRIFDQLDLKFTKHTNAWVPFILASMSLLRPGGRLAMVVPAEIIHVTHAQSLRRYLGKECRRLVIVDPEELWFDGTLQGAVILMAEKRSGPRQKAEGLGMVPVRGREFLRRSPAELFAAPQSINGKTVAGKWTRALLDLETRDLFDELERHPDVHRFEDIARVDVGIVTGANKFFLVSDEVVETYGLGKYAHPMFGRSEHCPGVIYDQRQHAANAEKGNPTNFLWFDDAPAKMKSGPRRYIELGERESLHTRYKCRIRAPWYKVPSVYSTEIGMLKRSHNTPRLILNRVGAYTTDTAYRIRTTDVAGERLVGCFLNPLTALSAELEGRHYGGGVLELIPSEIERLMIPLPANADIDIEALDTSIRTRPTHETLERQGNAVLGALGISAAKQASALEGWRKLRDRRHRTSTEALDA